MATTNTDSTSLTSRLSCVGEHLKNELLIVSGYLIFMPITLQPPMVQSVRYEFMENQDGNIVTVGKELRRMCRYTHMLVLVAAVRNNPSIPISSTPDHSWL